MQLPPLPQETADRVLVSAPGGIAAGSTVQLCPSHPSASTLKGPNEPPAWPTATHLAPAQETPDRTLPAGLTAGVARTVHVVPSHASASVTRGLPDALET